MADLRAAGAFSSGQGATFLDTGKPFSGIIAETMRRDPPRARTPAQLVATGDSRHCEVIGHSSAPNHHVGAIPRPGGRFQQVCIPGYGGHIAGKVAENVLGTTFAASNERATQILPLREMRRTRTAPETISAPGASGTRGLSVAPRVPGYAGTVPGKHSENVVEKRFAEANEAASALRQDNPYVTCHGWLRPGQWPGDRTALYKWNNRFSRADSHQLFTPEQEQRSYEANRDLGRTFGLTPAPRKVHKPGDRFLHSLYVRAQADAKRLDPTQQPAAGQPTHSAQLDSQRWRLHHALVMKNGNQRTY